MNVVGFKAQNSVRLSLSQHEATACLTLRKADSSSPSSPLFTPPPPGPQHPQPWAFRSVVNLPEAHPVHQSHLFEGWRSQSALSSSPAPSGESSLKDTSTCLTLAATYGAGTGSPLAQLPAPVSYPQSTWKVCDTGANTQD